MQRDMDLVREILLAVEDQAASVANFFSLELEGYEQAVVSYHLILLHEAGFIEGRRLDAIGADSQFYVDRLTWSGHEFLDDIRDPEIWRRTKAGVRSVGSLGVDIMWQVAKAYTKQLAKDRLGIEL